ncbi:hypothetical protein [Desulfuribacillus alkaliarsenatis]|uniref:Uncharacterized protein n=1 Tax=Desulfuribacillus alkaliarsenatis TaxID=766136 RepID=A0A1E5G277_9FIRM|nr:hypothetical protein [Desulfuribacillus alkaliarsenatis]OEF97075.1 hypothetical protein BHF68_05600 [Desulfuribacillus alkaliarsenatis]
MNEMGKKVTVDLYLVQMKWVAWYLPIVYVIYFAVVWFLGLEMRSMSLLTFTFQTATMFMLICGILSSLAFLPMYVKHGVTRKSYFQGAILSSIGLAISIIGITAVVTWVISLFEIAIFAEVELSSLGVNSWLLTTLSYIIVVMIYFLVGWLVGLGFYRYGGAGGFASILIAIVIVSLSDLLWAFGTPKPIMVGFLNLNIATPNLAVAFVGSIVLAAISMMLVHKLVKDTPIKIE